MSNELVPSVGALPQSTELHSTGPESLAELLSRDPEGYTKQDLAQVIEALRAQRVKFEAAEAAGKPARAPKALTGKAASLIAKASSEDLGL